MKKKSIIIILFLFPICFINAQRSNVQRFSFYEEVNSENMAKKALLLYFDIISGKSAYASTFDSSHILLVDNSLYFKDTLAFKYKGVTIRPINPNGAIIRTDTFYQKQQGYRLFKFHQIEIQKDNSLVLLLGVWGLNGEQKMNYHKIFQRKKYKQYEHYRIPSLFPGESAEIYIKYDCEKQAYFITGIKL